MPNITAIHLSDDDFKRMVNNIATDPSMILITHHARERMRERNIVRRQVDVCLQKGHVVEAAHINIHGNWQATMTRRVAGQDVKVAVAVELSRRLIVITAMKED